MLFCFANAELLKGNVSEAYIPKGFYGSWGVISKLDSSNNPAIFNKESRDIWTLSGYNNILILENLQNGARSEIEIKEKSKKDNLKFDRKRIVEKDNEKIIYKEMVEFKLYGNSFSGVDKFIVETYEKNVLKEKSEAKYIIQGVKISGEKPKLN